MKKLKYIFLMFICVILCGCTKVNTNMTINNDKSMVLSVDLLMTEEASSSAKELFNTRINEAKENGYTIEDKAKEFYGGKRISRKYDSIDDATYKGIERIKLSNYGDKTFDYNKIFSVKKGIFNNKYTAYFDFESLIDKYNSFGIKEEKEEINLSTNEKDNAILEDTIVPNNKNTTNVKEPKKQANTSEKTKTKEQTKTNEQTTLTTNEEKNTQVVASTKTKSVEDYAKVSEYTFTLTLPNKPIASNATEVSKDGLTLTWKLDPTNNNEVNFSFKMKNKVLTTIILVIGGIILLFGIVVGAKILINKYKRKELSERKPIFKGYDESIKDEVENNVGVPAKALIEKKEEPEPEIKEEAKEEVIENIDFAPGISKHTTSIQQLSNYEMAAKDGFLKEIYSSNNQTKIERKNVFVNMDNKDNDEKEKVNHEEQKPKTQEVDIPNIEELK